MFDKLFEVLTLVWNDLWFMGMIRENEQGVRLRFGKFHGVLNKGLYYKIPFIDTVIPQYVQDDTIILPSQKLMTADGKTITLTAIVLFSVIDVKEFVLNAVGPSQSISDVTAGAISEVILHKNYKDIVDDLDKLSKEMSIPVRRECKRYGAKIEYVKIQDITTSRTFNIFKNGEAHL